MKTCGVRAMIQKKALMLTKLLALPPPLPLLLLWSGVLLRATGLLRARHTSRQGSRGAVTLISMQQASRRVEQRPDALRSVMS